MEHSLTSAQQAALLGQVRNSLQKFLEGHTYESLPPAPDATLDQGGHGAFVTLHNGKALRGCIGCMESKEPLWSLVSHYAVQSAQDSRFQSNPVLIEELPELMIEISVLFPMQQISSHTEAVLGKHGIVVEKDWHRGVFLPQVAVETGWDLETYWMHCCRDKAGLAPDAYKSDPQVDLFIFEAFVFGENH